MTRVVMAIGPVTLLLLTAGCVDLPVSDSRDPYGGYGNDGYRTYPDYDEEVVRDEHRHYPCDQLEDRIRFDKQKIATIDPSKHHKALQWYRDDLDNARRDRERCRDERDDRRDWQREERRDWERDRERERERERDRALQQQQDRQRQEQQMRAQCDKIRDRIRYDQQQVATIDASKHHKALQWFKDDIQNAERDLQRCGGR